jgi:hypothetical protein
MFPTVRVPLVANAKDMMMRAVTGFHRGVFRASNGRLGNRGYGMPVEKAELWPRVVAAHRGYAQYQERTDRDIPLVILEQ